MKYNPGEYTLRVVYAFLPFSISVILLIIVSLAESREKKADQFIDSYLYGSFSVIVTLISAKIFSFISLSLSLYIYIYTHIYIIYFLVNFFTQAVDSSMY